MHVMEKKNEKTVQKTANRCSCSANLKKEVKQMVNEVEGYSKEDHAKKERELRDAFAEEKK